jgi:PAS domain S-box-containing protein
MARERTLSDQAFEQFPQALVVVDREATVLSMNAVAERLTGWQRADAAGRPAADILEVRTETGVNLCAPNGALRRTLRLGNGVNTHFAYLFRLRTSDDPVRVAYSVSALKSRGKTPHGAVIAIHDVTPELETIEARDALMLAASHELKTPLTTLKGLSELLLDFELSEAQRRELIQDLHGQADRMERLIGDILAVSRIDSGRVSVDFSRVDVAPVVKHVCEEVRPMLKGRTLSCRVSDELPPVFGEARKLHQILVNLLTNAIKYSEPGTRIKLSVRGEQSVVRFEVSDQGVGIRKEHLPRLFEKFYRADDPAVRRASGTGLGLYIVRNLVTMLGGQVQVRSEHGKGSVFIVTVPRAETTSAGAARQRRRVLQTTRTPASLAAGAG